MMSKVEKVSWQNIALYLAILLAIGTSLYSVRPRQYVSPNAPVFMSEEVKVKQAAVPAAVTVVGQKTADSAAPAPRPTAAPLPLIPPSIASRVLPAYPADALKNGTEGVVLLSVYVGMTGGQPQKIVTHTSSGNAELDNSAIKAVSQWKFLAATQGGQPLPSWFEVPVRFVIK